MARKPKRRYFPTRRPTRGRPDNGERQNQLDTVARQLADQHTLDELRALVAERTALLEEADQAGTNDPGAVNLARFHSARTSLQIAERALELASRDDAP